MDYFKILNLNREPFSNSPEPDFFFPPPGQLAILQQLEIAIRLRRGLNVVMGEVGTGKSTLCRQLIIRLSASEADRQEIETSLIMDPSFSTSREFLNIVSGCFGLVKREEPVSEWKLKDDIKNALFQKGIAEKKIVVMIIDEGQKIPFFTLEILREFLNYETNETKLLQIVIFAQNEFKETLAGIKNFADRINRYHFLSPLNFEETRGMIDFRLQRAAWPGRAPAFFTKPALLAIYLATGGFPRRIVTICHHILLAMIIKNRTKANLLLVQANVAKISLKRVARRSWTRKKTALATSFLIAIIMLVFLSTMDNILHLMLSTFHAEKQKVGITAAMPPARQIFEQPFATPLEMQTIPAPSAMPSAAPEGNAEIFSTVAPPPKDANTAAVQKDRRFIKLKRTWLHEGF